MRVRRNGHGLAAVGVRVGGRCAECAQECGRRHYRRHRDPVRAWHREWYRRNRLAVLARQRRYYHSIASRFPTGGVSSTGGGRCLDANVR